MSAVDPAIPAIAVAGITATAAVVGTWLTSRRGNAAAIQARDELRTNHGSSARDAIDRLEATLTRVDNRLDRSEARADRHGATLAELVAAVDGVDQRLARGDERFDRIEQRIAESGPQQITIVNPSKEEPQ